MGRKILFGLVFITIPLLLSAADLSVTEKAYTNAFMKNPSTYEYHEESGALFFAQKKNYCFDIRNNGSGLERIVTYSSTQNEQSVAEDPRPPIREGDCSVFCMKSLLCEADLFSPVSSLSKTPGGTKVIGGRKYNLIEVSYKYCDEEGQVWPMTGELLVHRSSGVPYRFTAVQLDFPNDVYSVKIEVDFTGYYSSTCRIAEYRRFEEGQYGILRYFYNTVRTFTY